MGFLDDEAWPALAKSGYGATAACSTKSGVRATHLHGRCLAPSDVSVAG